MLYLPLYTPCLCRPFAGGMWPIRKRGGGRTNSVALCRNYKEAAQLCTPSSEKWIRFVATNVTDSDLIVLNQSDVEPQYEVDDLNAIDDSTMTATIEANHYFHLHDIGQKADIKEADTYTFTLRRINGQWKIDLASVPRPTSQPQ